MGTWVELINGWIWPRLLPLLAAPAIGSFLGVLIRRLPAGRDVTFSRSACETCSHVLTVPELVPILSYLRQRGRCTVCAAPIAPEHLHVELTALAVALAAAALVPPGAFLWLACLLGWWLLALAWIDAQTYRLPNVLTLPLIPAGLAEAALWEPEALPDRAIAAALAYTALYLLAFAYRRLRHRDGLGLGDAKLLAAAGAWAGTAQLPFVLCAGAVLALIYAAFLRLRGTDLSATTRLPFGPFLALATWLAWVARPL